MLSSGRRPRPPRFRAVSRWVRTGAVAATLGCSPVTDLPDGTRVPVIQAVIVAGQATHAAWVEWGSPSDSGYGPATRPVLPALVNLRVEDSTGSAAAFTPSPSTPGQFDVDLQALAGAVYHLSGDVAGRAVAADARVPTLVFIRQPQADTVIVVAGTSLLVRWSTGNAAVFAVRVQRVSGGGPAPGTIAGVQYTNDTTAIVEGHAAGDTTIVSVMGLDPAAAAFFDPARRTATEAARGNIRGVAGVFGAATVARRVIIWRS